MEEMSHQYSSKGKEMRVTIPNSAKIHPDFFGVQRNPTVFVNRSP